MRIRSSQRHPSRRKTVHVTNGSVASKQRINALTAQCQPGWSLPRGFYSDQEIYGLDVERIWRHGWLFAAHSCEIRAPGDFARGAQWGAYDGSLFVATLKQSDLRRFTFAGPIATQRDIFFDGTYGRMRTARQAPDGSLYVTTSNGSGDWVIRITPTQ